MLRLAWLPIAQHVFQPALTGRHELISQNIVSSEQEQRLSRWAGFAKNCLPLIQCKELPQFCEKYRALGRHVCKICEIDGQKNGVQHATAIYPIPRYTRSRYIGLTLYNKTLHTSLHWLKQGINHSLNPQNTSCTEAASSPLHLLWADEGDIKPEGKAVYCTGLEHCEGDGDLDIVKVVFVSTLEVHCVFVGPRHTDTDVKCVLQEKEWTDYKCIQHSPIGFISWLGIYLSPGHHWNPWSIIWCEIVLRWMPEPHQWKVNGFRQCLHANRQQALAWT